MRFRGFALALGLGALAGTPCLALTIQTGPPPSDVAQHLRPQTGPTFSVLPAPGDLKDSFVASGRAQLGQGFLPDPANARTTSFSFGSFHGATTVTPGYGAFWNSASPRDRGNPLSLTPPRP
jgi:hypothetical protein